MRRAARRDGPEREIIAALQLSGFHVAPVNHAGLPDLLMSRAGRWYVAEVKARHGKLTPAQVAFCDEARAPVPIFRSVDDALNWANSLNREGD